MLELLFACLLGRLQLLGGLVDLSQRDSNQWPMRASRGATGPCLVARTTPHSFASTIQQPPSPCLRTTMLISHRLIDETALIVRVNRDASLATRERRATVPC